MAREPPVHILIFCMTHECVDIFEILDGKSTTHDCVDFFEILDAPRVCLTSGSFGQRVLEIKIRTRERTGYSTCIELRVPRRGGERASVRMHLQGVK